MSLTLIMDAYREKMSQLSEPTLESIKKRIAIVPGGSREPVLRKDEAEYLIESLDTQMNISAKLIVRLDQSLIHIENLLGICEAHGLGGEV